MIENQKNFLAKNIAIIQGIGASPDVIKLISADQALGCPQCGSFGFAAKGKTTLTSCPHCSTGLLPQEDVFSRTVAARSHFTNCLSHPEVMKKGFTGFRILENTNIDAFELLGRIGSYQLNLIVENLSGTGIKKDQTPFLEQEFFESVTDRQAIMSSIIDMPDKNWNIVDAFDTSKIQSKNIFLSMAHPNGTYSIVRATNWPETGPEYKANRDHHDNVFVKFIKLERSPESQAEFDLLNSGKILTNEITKGMVIAEGNYFYDTKDWLSKSEMVLDDKRKPFIELLLQMPKDRDKATEYWKEKLSGQDKNFWINLMISQEIWFADSLTEKIINVSSLISEANKPFGDPIINQEEAAIIDDAFFLDKILIGELKPTEATPIYCGHCGDLIENYQVGKAFADCGSCSRTNDFIGTGRISPQMLEARKYEDTFVPLKYFMELLNEQARRDKNANDSLPINPQKIIELMFGEGKVDNTEIQEGLFQIVNGLVKIMAKNPHLLSGLHYSKRHGMQRGISLAIEIPSSNTIQLQETDRSQTIPESQKGKVLLLRFADFGRPLTNASFAWCKLNSAIVDKSQLKNISTTGQWEELFTYQPNSILSNILQSTGGIIGSVTSRETDTSLSRYSGKFFELILDTIARVQRGTDLKRILSNA